MRKEAANIQKTLQRAWRCFGSHFAFGAVTLMAIGGVASSRAQTTVYQDNFSGAGGPLNGAAVDVGGQTWTAGPAFLDDGTVNTVVADGPNGEAAWLPFTPSTGRIYTLSVEIENLFSDWIAVGFMPALPPGGDWTATDFSVRHSNNGAHAWMLTRNDGTRNDQEAFNGPNTSNGAFGGDIVPANVPVAMMIVLDTRAATWTAEYFLNGASQGVFSLPASANTDIGGVGFSRDRNATAGTGGSLANFLLTEEIAPLPGAWDGDVSNLWSVAANWAGDTLPNFFGFNDSLTFADPASGASGVVVNDVVGAQLVQILFEPSAPAFTLTGNAVQLSTGVSNPADPNSPTQEIAFNVTGTGVLNLNAGGPLAVSGVVSGSGGLTKGGDAPLTLSNGSNNFSGPVSFSGAGNIVLTASGALGDPGSTVALNASFQGPLAGLEFAGASQAKTYNLNARQVGEPAHIVATAGVNTLTGQINGFVGGNRYVFDAAAGSELNIVADFSMLDESAAQRLIRCDNDGVVNLNGQLEDAPEGTRLGVAHANGAAGTLNVNGPKNYSGDTLAFAGTVALVDATTTNNVPNSQVLRCDAPDGTLDFSGLMGGGIVLTSGQTLAGDGTVVGSVVASAGSTIAPGVDGVGVLELPDLTLNDGSHLAIEIGAGVSDRINIVAGGSLDGPATGSVNIAVSNAGDIAAGDYIILDWSAASSANVQLSDFSTDAGTLAIVNGTQLQLSVLLTSLADVLISDTGNDRVLKYNVTQFNVLVSDPNLPVFAEGVVGAFTLLSPVGMTTDSAGNVYLAEGDPGLQDRVMKLDPSTGNHIATIAEVDSLDPGLDFSGTPAHLVVDPDDNYLFMSIAQPNSTANDPNLDDVIYRVDLSGVSPPQVYIPTTDVGGTYVLENPQGLAFGRDGFLYVANNLDPAGSPDPGSRVLRFDVGGPTGVFAGTLTTEHRDTKGLFYDVYLERLLVSLNQLNDIWAYGDLTLDYVAIGDPSYEAVFDQGADQDYPDVIFAAGNVYFTDSTNDVVRRVDAVNSAPEALGAAAGLVDPHSLLILSEIDPFDFDNDGNVDRDDRDVFLAALAGPDATTPPVGVSDSDFQRADIDNDGDVDMKETWVFMRRFTD